jgi:hypothetical protein
MRLDDTDVIVLERGATASIYIKGGGVVHLHDVARFELPKAAQATGSAASRKLERGAIAQLESGLWVLNDPGGGLLVSPMRGDAADDDTVPLSPRYEALTEPCATFVWSGGPPKARVVVAKKREVVWTSAPTAPGTLLAAGSALPLAAGEIYTWWIEPEAGGAPLTAGIPFRVAAAEVIASTKALEAELVAMNGDAEGKAAAGYLRLAHIRRLGQLDPGARPSRADGPRPSEGSRAGSRPGRNEVGPSGMRRLWRHGSRRMRNPDVPGTLTHHPATDEDRAWTSSTPARASAGRNRSHARSVHG